MWIHLFLVRLACAREGHFAGVGAFKVDRFAILVMTRLLTFIFLISLLAAERHAYFRTFIIANVAGIFSLFPLLFTPAGIHFSSYARQM